VNSPIVPEARIGSGNPIELFYQAAAASQDQLALVSAKTKLSYHQLERLSRQISRKLSRLGIKKGAVVGVDCKPEITVVIWLALLQLGATSLSVNRTILESYGEHIDFVVVDDSLSRLKHKNVVPLGVEFFESLDATAPLDEVSQLKHNDLVRVVFSSGTTGIPKGVPFTIEVLLARIDSARSNWIPIQPFMSMLGPDTVSGFQTVFAQLFTGNTCYLNDGSSGWGLIKEHGIRSIKTSPAKLADLVREFQPSKQTSTFQNQLSVIQVAGSLLSKSLAIACQETLDVTPTYLYGSTEVGTVTRGSFDQSRPNSVGAVIPEVECEIVDEQNQTLLTGELGFVRVRRTPMAAGYWKSPTPTETGFRDGWFYPGDRGALEIENRLVIDGRSDDLVNAGGVKVNLAKLDQALSDLSQLTDVATFEFPGELGEPLLGLAFTAVGTIDIPEIEHLAQFHAPGVRFNALVRLESIPRNSLGKVLRHELSVHTRGEPT